MSDALDSPVRIFWNGTPSRQAVKRCEESPDGGGNWSDGVPDRGGITCQPDNDETKAADGE